MARVTVDDGILDSGSWPVESSTFNPRLLADRLGSRLDRIKSWLDENCGANEWAMTPSGTRGVLNDALSIYFGDPTLAGAFVTRWCAGHKIETAGGVFQVREDEPTPGVGATLHRTP